MTRSHHDTPRPLVELLLTAVTPAVVLIVLVAILLESIEHRRMLFGFLLFVCVVLMLVSRS